MSTEKVRIKLKAYDHRVLDDAVTRIVETVKRSGGEVVGPVPLPTEIEKCAIELVLKFQGLFHYLQKKKYLLSFVHHTNIKIVVSNSKCVHTNV